MTRKDYELIARELRARVPSGETPEAATVRLVLRVLASRLSSAFMADNPRFDPETFTKACGF